MYYRNKTLETLKEKKSNSTYYLGNSIISFILHMMLFLFLSKEIFRESRKKTVCNWNRRSVGVVCCCFFVFIGTQENIQWGTAFYYVFINSIRNSFQFLTNRDYWSWETFVYIKMWVFLLFLPISWLLSFWSAFLCKL